ncbi:MAG: hypothetical protein K5865_00505 [Eubacterium sp.]|nr:hypothetical protein [Eubacterium sp.]
MGNKVARILFGIIIAVGILVGGYFILPGKVHYPIKQFIQSKTNDNYDKVIDPLKKSIIPKNKEITYGEAFEKLDSSAWTIEESDVDDKGDGTYTIYADAYNITVSLEGEDSDDSLITKTNAHVRCEFNVTKQGSEILIDNKPIDEKKGVSPTLIGVDETNYSKNGNDTFFQQCLDIIAHQTE